MTRSIQRIRLTWQEQQALISALQEALMVALQNSRAGPWQAKIWLFGSRTDPSKKGGDIDLFVDIDTELEEESSWRRLMIRKIHEKIGERRIDLVIRTLTSPPSALYDLILEEGVLLCKISPQSKLTTS